MNAGNTVQILDRATRMLAEIRTAPDAKQVMDIASAAEHYARKHKLGEEAIGHAHAIKTDASAMLGEFIYPVLHPHGKRQPKAGGDQRLSKQSATTDSVVALLEDLGIDLSWKESVETQLLAAIKKEQPEEFEKIKAREKTLTQVKRERTREKALARLQEFPSGKFRVVYADPPWKYDDTLAGDLDESYGGAEKHYPAMTITELSALPVREHIDDDAVLFLWVTSPLLFECKPVANAWGFTYKASFIWDKVKHNLGHYNSVRHEFLLIFTCGSCLPDNPKLFDSVQSVERTNKHSEKPEVFREIIDTIYPHGRRVELFATKKLPEHWETWGT